MSTTDDQILVARQLRYLAAGLSTKRRQLAYCKRQTAYIDSLLGEMGRSVQIQPLKLAITSYEIDADVERWTAISQEANKLLEQLKSELLSAEPVVSEPGPRTTKKAVAAES